MSRHTKLLTIACAKIVTIVGVMGGSVGWLMPAIFAEASSLMWPALGGVVIATIALTLWMSESLSKTLRDILENEGD